MTTLTGPQILDVAAMRMGFLDTTELRRVASWPSTRLTMILVRCGGGRFVAPAQDVQHFIDMVEGAGDYVRDVSVWRGGGA